MHWKKRLMIPPPDEGKAVEVIREGGAASETLSNVRKYTDQSSDSAAVRIWDELNVQERCDRLGKWIGYIMNNIEDKE